MDNQNTLYSPQLLIEDFYHLQKIHQSELHQITELIQSNGMLNNCSIESCAFANRHYRIGTEKELKYKYQHDYNMVVVIDILDAIHYYLSHLFDCGLRIHEETKHSKPIASDVWDFYDHRFAQLSERIFATDEASRRFSRISMLGKYILLNLEYQKSMFSAVNADYEDDGTTYLDFVFDEL